MLLKHGRIQTFLGWGANYYLDGQNQWETTMHEQFVQLQEDPYKNIQCIVQQP